jgi:hypothetical protein
MTKLVQLFAGGPARWPLKCVTHHGRQVGVSLGEHKQGRNLAYCISLDSTYNVYVSGFANGGNTSLLTTLKYSQLTGASNVFEPVVLDMQLNNFPNPFNPVTTISYAIPQDGKLKITVYNSLGAKERELVNEYLSAGNYEIQFDGKNLPSGAYYCILESRSRMLTRRILLVK